MTGFAATTFVTLSGCGGDENGDGSPTSSTRPDQVRGGDVIIHNEQDAGTKVLLEYRGHDENVDGTMDLDAGESKSYDIPSKDNDRVPLEITEVATGDIEYTRRSARYDGLISASNADAPIEVRLTSAAIIFSGEQTTSQRQG
ncbi:MAG: hypothetical protein ABEI52_11235 [Halobacteriaceae archaeon]